MEGGSVAANSIRSPRFPGPDGAGIRLGDDGNFYPSLSAADLSVAANSGSGRGGGIFNAGSLAVSGGVIGGSSNADGNAAGVQGGGLDNEQVATLDDVTVLRNKAQFGAGIDNLDRLSVTGGSLSGNRAQDASGLENDGAQATLTGVKVAGNKAGDQAGGLSNIDNGASLSVSGGSITGNPGAK
jgi:hypothetical protein